MKDKRDVVRGWLRKAESDEKAIKASLDAGVFDIACFHAQQAAEKALKAYLAYAGVDFPFTHNLSKLTDSCSAVDPAFSELSDKVEVLTPFAVELRYDADFWPPREDAEDAMQKAVAVRAFVLSHIDIESTGSDGA